MISETRDLYKNIAIMGMWIFIGSELLFFGGVFLSLTVYRHLHFQIFSEGTEHLNLLIGSANTGILLTSSWTLAMAIEKYKSKGEAKPLLLTTIFLGALFIVLKAVEYLQHYNEGLFPVLNWNLTEYPKPPMLLFFILYFIMTAIHALHVLVGLGLIAWITKLLKKESSKTVFHESAIENVGLYWHFVDIIWVFIFPMLYLIGRNS
ncbi:MAG: cytochrome c oxidase subunit 3 [Bdellovibrio sp.]